MKRTSTKELSKTRSRTARQSHLTGDETLAEVGRWLQGSDMAVVRGQGGIVDGFITINDIRDKVLAGDSLQTPVRDAIRPLPPVSSPGHTRIDRQVHLERHALSALPIVDQNGRLTGTEYVDTPSSLPGTRAILMAGGKGMRLRPLTLNTPKPLLRIGGQPILDILLNRLRRAGVLDAAISVNYLREHIKEHVGNGARYGMSVDYIEEKECLDTAGALALLAPRPSQSFLVMNADLLTELDFNALHRFHRERENDLTVCVRQESSTVPFGVLSVDNEHGNVRTVREKPELLYLVNAGIYMLEPAIIDLVPAGSPYDMVSLIQAAMDSGLRVGAFPLVEYWRDIGRPDEMRKASREWLNRHRTARPDDSVQYMDAGTSASFTRTG